MIPSTWERVHAGSVVLAHDGEQWGVLAVTHEPALAVTITRFGRTVTAWPAPGTPITVVHPVDTSAEAHAFNVLANAGLDPRLISEAWERAT